MNNYKYHQLPAKMESESDLYVPFVSTIHTSKFTSHGRIREVSESTVPQIPLYQRLSQLLKINYSIIRNTILTRFPNPWKNTSEIG